MADCADIPVVDFSALSLHVADRGDADRESVEALGDAIVNAFTSTGFVFLRNSGIEQDEVDELMRTCRKFFELPHDVKMKYIQQPGENAGYRKMGTQTFESDKPSDLRESFDIFPSSALVYPDEEVPELESATVRMSAMLKELSLRILYSLAVALRLEDLAVFDKAHSEIGKSGYTGLRCLYYPAVPNIADLYSADIKANQMRCGQHSDWGTITLLFQDTTGGLEVLKRDGEYVEVKSMRDAVFVNVGDLLQRWTSSKLISSLHRVQVVSQGGEAGETHSRPARQSLAYFVIPDSSAVVTPLVSEKLDGTAKYAPINAGGYMIAKLRSTFY